MVNNNTDKQQMPIYDKKQMPIYNYMYTNTWASLWALFHFVAYIGSWILLFTGPGRGCGSITFGEVLAVCYCSPYYFIWKLSTCILSNKNINYA